MNRDDPYFAVLLAMTYVVSFYALLLTFQEDFRMCLICSLGAFALLIIVGIKMFYEENKMLCEENQRRPNVD